MPVRRPARRVLLVLALYALLVAAGPLLHHDFSCHVKSPRHCTACVASPSAVGAPADVVLEPMLAEVDGMTPPVCAGVSVHQQPRLPARAPPA